MSAKRLTILSPLNAILTSTTSLPWLKCDATWSFSTVTQNAEAPLLGFGLGESKPPIRVVWLAGLPDIFLWEPRGEPQWTKTKPGPQPTRKERPIIKPTSPTRFSLWLTKESSLGTKPNWLRAPTTLIPTSRAVPIALGSSIGEGVAVGVVSRTKGCLRG